MLSRVGVMQGRLLPKYHGRYQAHPAGYWQEEFSIAKKLGLSCIEFILDYNDAKDNPLLSNEGIDNINAIIDKTGVAVKTICADYFMEAPIHSENQNVALQSSNILTRLLNNSVSLGVTDVVIPCVDQSSLSSQIYVDNFVQRLSPIVDIAENTKINISLETDLSPEPFAEILDCFDSDRITVNYDIGNSAALGYSPSEELNVYGDRITDIHIKDRLLNGGSVVLGEGDANFNLFFDELKKIDYTGVFIMQAYRDNEGVSVFKKQLDWIMPILENYKVKNS
jgi:L-ribulose-5-phosphate 3-epimerase